jgi:hypothetical protein
MTTVPQVCRLALGGTPVRLALNPAEDMLAVVCADPSSVRLILLPICVEVGQVDSGDGGIVDCCWVGPNMLIATLADRAGLRVLSTDGSPCPQLPHEINGATSACVSPGWNSVYIGAEKTIHECDAGLTLRRLVPTGNMLTENEDAKIDQLQCIDDATLFVGLINDTDHACAILPLQDPGSPELFNWEMNEVEELEAKQSTRFRHFVGAAPEWGRCLIGTSLGADLKAFKRDGTQWEEDEHAIDDEVPVDLPSLLARTEEYLQVDSATALPPSSQHRQHP